MTHGHNNMYVSTPTPSSLQTQTSLLSYQTPPFISNFVFTLQLIYPLLPKKALFFNKIQHRKTQFWRIFAFREDVLASDTTPLKSSQQIVSTSDDITASIIHVLLFVAFVALSILTVGVIYIGVTDFLGKREREKFEKEEATKKKSKIKARAGPRGFGQQVNKDDDDLDS